MLGYAIVVAHHNDMGGRVPGSNASDSTEIYAEGLRIPPVKLHDRGVPNDTLLRLLERNVRVPVRVMGDLRAQLAQVLHQVERERIVVVDHQQLHAKPPARATARSACRSTKRCWAAR